MRDTARGSFTAPHRLRTALTAACVSLMLVLVGAAACAQSTTPKETVESLRAKSPTLKDKLGLRIVVRHDVPLMGLQDPATGKYSGFEIELAKAVAKELGYAEGQITWVRTENLVERQTFLQNNQADLTVATLSITDERERFVDFAGPYLLVPQALLVRRDRKKDLNTIADLRADGVRICTLTGSTSEKALVAKGVTPDPVDNNHQCAQGLLSGKVDAFSTDLPILAGFLSVHRDELEILTPAIADSSERLGIAGPNDDEALRQLVSYILHRWQTGPQESSPWMRAYDATIGPLLDPKYRSQPHVHKPPDLADYDSKAPRR